jgi:quinone-modifying oxidoreductase subunit QmoC
MAVEADPKFVREVISLGGKTLKRCMQCATCSVVCPLSPEENPFPRKEMIWAQWGLKEKLLRDPDVWLCHNCNDCSKYCPRDARPGEVLAALRARMIAEYSWPSFMAKIVNNPVYFPLFVLIPIILIGGLISAFNLSIPTGSEDIVYSEFIPMEYVEIGGFVFGGLALLVGLIGLWRFWNALTEGGGKHIVLEPEEGAELEVKGGMGFIDAVFYALKDILTHSWFKICGVNKNRYYAHFLIFYGFIALGITAGLDVIAKYVFGMPHLPLWHPAKILGNLGAIALFLGCAFAIYNRLTNKDVRGGSYFDWFFLLVLFGVAVTGILTELARLAGSVAAYWLYLAHLVTVFMLLVYAPYSKFAHLIYRGVAMAYAKTTGREPKIPN